MTDEPTLIASASVNAGVYLRAREKEGRLYPDAVVATLPNVPRTHPLRQEWRQRGDSAARLIAYLEGLPSPLVVFDIGCGNGWLASRVAGIEGSTVLGIDVNEVELAQARRVFGGRPNLRFAFADALIAPPPPPSERPDIILLASVVQYMPDLRDVLARLLEWLAPSGELHILDSPFYSADELSLAEARSRAYYATLGVPEMTEMYRHHDWGTLEGFVIDVLYRPNSTGARLTRWLPGSARSPFPWIRMRASR